MSPPASSHCYGKHKINCASPNSESSMHRTSPMVPCHSGAPSLPLLYAMDFEVEITNGVFDVRTFVMTLYFQSYNCDVIEYAVAR